MRQPADKCLSIKSFLNFEPQCSKSGKPANLKGLAQAAECCNAFYQDWLFGAEFDTISTAG